MKPRTFQLLSRRRQRGFLMNPFRFASSVQQGVFTAEEAGGNFAAVGASITVIASGAMSADGVSTFGASAEAQALLVDAADFDGTNDWLSCASLAGQADSKTGILSYWISPDVSTGDPFSAGPRQGGAATPIGENTQSVMKAFDSTGTVLNGAYTAPAIAAWHHILIAWDVSAAYFKVFKDGVDVTGASTINNRNLKWGSVTEWIIGEYIPSDGNGSKIDAGLAEFYFAPGQFLDITVSANLRKFRTSDGKPANLGSTGSSPTGSVPLIYLHLDPGETVSNFAINRSSMGNFTVNGTLSFYDGSPSGDVLAPDSFYEADSAILGPGTANAQFQLKSNGKVAKTNVNNTVVEDGSWIRPNASASLYECFATLNSGTLNSGTTGSWLALTSTRTWVKSKSSPPSGSSTCELTIQIRKVGSAVTESTTVTLIATVED